MKKIMLLLPLLACHLVTLAQFDFGIKGGYTLSNIRSFFKPMADAPRVRERYDVLSTFHAGFTVDIPLSANWSMHPDLLYSRKGYKGNGITTLDGGGTVSYTTRLGYIELPINVLYKLKAGSNKFFAGMGPYLAFGVEGMIKAKTSSGRRIEEHIKFSKQTDANDVAPHYRPFDAGANFIAGYELHSEWVFSVNYSLGLTNITYSDIYTEKNRYLGVSAAYLLRRKK
ncbi:porin family protein [Chitinophaga vietnamensis]|uniref:porin family protein n=1 Tax=Chitinophaga vietnamensis TaxID=2593957 RepID=UPI0011783BB9|nr:porin family protein [Chitinophaga vietnamensis]